MLFRSVGITWTETQLDEVCNAFASVSSCARPKISGCPKEVSNIWKSVDEGFEYLCTNPGKGIYVAHQECFARPDLYRELEACNRTFFSESQAAARAGSRQAILDGTCRAINRFVGCTSNSAETTCGEEAADFQYTLVSKLIAGTLDLIDCRLTGGATSVTVTWLTVAMVIYSAFFPNL